MENIIGEKMRDKIAKKYYKIISQPYFIGVMLFSFVSSILAMFFSREISLILMIPIIMFFLVQFVFMLSLSLSNEVLRKLAKINLEDGDSISIKELSKKLGTKPHRTYAIMSMMEKCGYLSFAYRYQGQMFKEKPKNKNYSLVLKFETRR